MDGSDAQTGTDGDADDEGAGPSRLGPRFKQRTIDFAAARVQVRPPAGTSGATAALAARTLVLVTGVASHLPGVATGPTPAGRAAPGVADPPCEAAPAKRRRRKRRDADQQPASKSSEDAPEPDREAAAAEAPEAKVDPRQRTICFAAARPRAAPPAKPPAGVAPGEETAAANPVDLTAPSPCDEDHEAPAAAAAAAAAPAAAAHAGPAGQDDVPASPTAAVRPKKKRQRKRSKVEQPADAGSCEDIVGNAPAPSRAASAVDPRQRTLTFAGAQPRAAAAPAEGGAAEQPALYGGVPSEPSAAEAGSLADAPAGTEAAAASVPAVTAAGPSTAREPTAATGAEGPAAKPPKRAYRKMSKQAADPAVSAREANAQQSDDAMLGVPTAAGPQPDPGQRKLSFAAARPRLAAGAVTAGSAADNAANPPPDSPRADDGHPAAAVTALQREGVALPCMAGCTAQHELACAPEALPTKQAEVCTIYCNVTEVAAGMGIRVSM